MKRNLSLIVLLAALGGAALAEEYRLGDLAVEDPWAREMPPVSATGAAWFRLVNHGAADRIVSVHSAVAERAALHAHEIEDGVAKMRHLPSLEVPAMGELVFEPGARHVMLIGLEDALVAGESFPMTIRFEQAGDLEVAVLVKALEVAGHDADSGQSNQSKQFFEPEAPLDALA